MNITAADREVLHSIVVAAPLEEVWHAWTTEEGTKSFFAQGANIDLRPDGDYEILFSPDNPPGQRGAEGTRLLAVERARRIAFSWNAPPKWPEIRTQRTVVEVALTPLGENSTEVRLRHTGWGQGADWDAVYDYFERAWTVVLKRLQYSFDHGPVDWDQLPEDLLHRG